MIALYVVYFILFLYNSHPVSSITKPCPVYTPQIINYVLLVRIIIGCSLKYTFRPNHDFSERTCPFFLYLPLFLL